MLIVMRMVVRFFSYEFLELYDSVKCKGLIGGLYVLLVFILFIF